MAKQCPLLGTAIYMDCMECEDKSCKQNSKSFQYEKIVIGIDQSYKNTGISIAADGKLRKVRSIQMDKCKSNSEKRKLLRDTLRKVLETVQPKSRQVVCIVERIRLKSQGFLNIDYIKSIGALNSTIVDICSDYGVEVYSVDTRCWKSQVVGTSKPESNKYGVPEEKWPTVRWVIDQGFRKSILIRVEGRKSKGTFVKNGVKYMYNNDAADSAGIAMFGFWGDRDKLREER